MSPLAISTMAIVADAERIRSIWLEMEAERMEECTCDRDPLGPCASCDEFGSLNEEGEVAVWNATLADCLRECEESNREPEPGILELERAIYNAKMLEGMPKHLRGGRS